MKHNLIFVCFLILFIVVVFGQEEAPVISIPNGQLRGTSNRTFKGNFTYFAYRGIPYAKKPVGDLRFAPPEKSDPWKGTLDATKDKDMCTQLGTVPVNGATSADVVGSEDCLYINVYTTNVNGSLPVMVWIYGGGFVGGTSSNAVYGPDYLLEKGVVYVAFNYRLGVFGFLSTEDSVAPGNWGLKDQILALKWVKENIRHFGGDPDKVTVFGQSAGGVSISYLLQSPLSAGLYRGAIMQSGSSLCLPALTRNARLKALNIGFRLGVITLNSQALIRNLRQVNYKTLKLAEANVTTQSYLTEGLLAGIAFGVVTEPDHPGAVFSGKSWQLLYSGNFQKVPIVIGHTSNEAASLVVDIDQLRPILVQYELDITRLPPYDLTQNLFKRFAAGVEVRSYFFEPGAITGQTRALTRFVTVDQFKRPIRENVILTSRFSDVYYYQFSYKGPLGDPNNTFQGVAHAEDLRYLFRLFDSSRDQPVNKRDASTIQKFVTLWTNFAKTLNPTPASGTGNGSVLGGLTWEPNNARTNTSAAIKYLNINNTLMMDVNPFQADWNFYERLYGRYGDPPYTTY